MTIHDQAEQAALDRFLEWRAAEERYRTPSIERFSEESGGALTPLEAAEAFADELMALDRTRDEAHRAYLEALRVYHQTFHAR